MPCGGRFSLCPKVRRLTGGILRAGRFAHPPSRRSWGTMTTPTTGSAPGTTATIDQAELHRAAELIGRVNTIFSSRVVGQDALRTAMVSTLMASGHILLESVPGLATTTAAHTLARAVSGTFSRIQCAPDRRPKDTAGQEVFNYTTGEFTTQLGPVHANIVLPDELNRSSAKTQPAMLKAMQER